MKKKFNKKKYEKARKEVFAPYKKILKRVNLNTSDKKSRQLV